MRNTVTHREGGSARQNDLSYLDLPLNKLCSFTLPQAVYQWLPSDYSVRSNRQSRFYHTKQSHSLHSSPRFQELPPTSPWMHYRHNSLLISSTSRSNCSVILPQISIKGHLKTLKILYRLTQFPTPIREIGDNTHGSMGLRGSTAIGDSGPISTNYRQYLLSWAMFKMFPCVRSVALCTGTCISASIPVARSSGVTTSYADYTRVHGPSDGYRGWYTMLIELGLSSSSSEFHYLRDHC